MPPPRGTTAIPLSAATRTASAASSDVCGNTTPRGRIPGCQNTSLAKYSLVSASKHAFFPSSSKGARTTFSCVSWISTCSFISDIPCLSGWLDRLEPIATVRAAPYPARMRAIEMRRKDQRAIMRAGFKETGTRERGQFVVLAKKAVQAWLEHLHRPVQDIAREPCGLVI